MRRFSFFFLLTVLPLIGFGQRQVVNLNRHWIFNHGWETNIRTGSHVNLPHTWNHDALGGKADYYRGMGNYSKVIEIPKDWQGRHIYIRFGGANSLCDLYINGNHLGQHKGGYTAFGWEISKHLNYGERNTIWARVSNADNLEIAPLSGAYNMYGGLYRDAKLIALPEVYILDETGGNGLRVTTVDVRNDDTSQATVHTTVSVGGPAEELIVTTLTLRDREGNAVDSLTRRTQLGADGRGTIAAAFTVENPRFWNGVQDPYLYSIEARVSTDKAHDVTSQNFGIRTFRVDEKNIFYLNEKPFKIKGVVRVEDWAGLGNALYRENHRRDIELMKEMGVNAVRTAYFPSDPYFVELCDKAGILVWCDLPLSGSGTYIHKGYSDSEAFKANARLQMKEIITQYYNHPSIVWWGLFDQLTELGDNPVELIRELNEYAQAEGGGRLTVAASNQDGDLNFITDLIGFNQFIGWTDGLPEGFETWTKDLREEFPKLKSGVSGYGAGANPYQHSDSINRPNIEGSWHPEQWQTRYHEKYWKVISSDDYFWGTFAWSMFDYGYANGGSASQPGILDFGLVSFDRGVKKDAFYFYKANWNKFDPFVYITARRWDVRPSALQDIKIYSNQLEVELFVNGTSLGVKANDGLGCFVWSNVKLKEGENSIEAYGPLSGKTDRITITVEPERILPNTGRSVPSRRRN